MANTINANVLSTKLAVTQYDFDPDATSLTDIGWVDFRDIQKMLISFFRTVGTSAVVFKIIANTASDGSGSEAVIKTISPAAAPDAVGDYVFGEIHAEEVRQKGEEDGKAYRYVSANISVATGTDEGVVTYIAEGRFCRDGLTSDVVA